MNLERLDLEKYEVLEMERNETISSKEFQKWMSELNVSQSYEDRSGIIKANDLNRQYNYSNAESRTLSILNLFR